VPEGVDVNSLKRQFLKKGGSPILSVHDLHVWSLSSGAPILTAHMEAKQGVDPHESLVFAHQVCKKNGIDHATIQVGPAGHPCASGLCCD
jgi:cobalt-zinc-cadmium efflux system protein